MWSEPLMSKIVHRPQKGRGQTIIFLRNSYGNTIVNGMNRHGDTDLKHTEMKNQGSMGSKINTLKWRKWL
jgi:hypothetical protein